MPANYLGQMKSVVWLLCEISMAIGCYGQVLRKPVAASYAGMGAYSTNHIDVFSFNSNQASLAQLKKTTAGIYGERRFFLGALSDYHAAIALITEKGNFGLKLRYYGSAAYRETQIGMAHARKLGSKMDIGIQFNYNSTGITGYGTVSAISAECGAVFHISEKVNTGIHINSNLAITWGIGYEPSPIVFISGEIIKEEDQPVSINAGMQYEFISELFARTGISSATSSVWFGIGFLWKKIRLDLVSSCHPQLGVTPGLLIAFDFASKTPKEL